MKTLTKSRFSTADAEALYNLNAWGGDYFEIDKTGKLCVKVTGSGPVALLDILDDLHEQGPQYAAYFCAFRRLSRTAWTS